MDMLLVEALENSLARLEAGQSLEACLQAYPELAEGLRPLLETAQRTIAARPTGIPGNVLQRSRKRMLSQARSHQIASNSRRIQLPRFVPAMAAAALVLLASSRVIAASAQSLPGDSLYPIKRTVERVKLQISAEDKRAGLRDEFRQRRTKETQALLEAHREEESSLFGVLSEKAGNRLLVEGVWIEVIQPIPGDSELEIGDYLEVEGWTTSTGTLTASGVERLAYDLRGILQRSTDGTWSIDGFQIGVDDSNKLDGYVSGDAVTLRIELDEDGTPRVKGVKNISPQKPDRAAEEIVPQREDEFEPDEDEEVIKLTGELEARTPAYLRVAGSYFLIGLESEIDDGLKVGEQVKVEAFRIGAGPYILDKAERARDEDRTEGENEREKESEPDDDDPSGDDD